MIAVDACFKEKIVRFTIRTARLSIILILLIGLHSCSTKITQPEGIWHTLAPGETLESLSRKYSVPITDIKRSNDIYDPNDLAPGIQLYIPIPARILPQQVTPIPEKPVTKTRFAWPSQGTISSGFGLRHGKIHQGIDITRDNGRDIRAAGSGVVEFAGIRIGYGKTVIINHGGGYKTLYGHNLKLYVTKGMKVSTGVIISRMGSSGKSTGIHLHFEVLYRGKPQNPLRYLPVR